MTFTTFMIFLAGALQLIVAAYALRLRCIFGLAHVGWSLFGAFTLIALLHLVQAVLPSGSVTTGVPSEGLYALISLLLLVNLFHLETVLKEQIITELKERRLRAELEAEVQKKTGYLMRALEQLQAEMDERKRMDAEVECLKLIRPRIFDCFVDLIKDLPAPAIMKLLAQESYGLEVDLNSPRPLVPLEVGSILIFARFVVALESGRPLRTSVILPPAQVAFYRQTIARLIEAGELAPAALAEFERTFSVRAPTVKADLGQLPRVDRAVGELMVLTHN